MNAMSDTHRFNIAGKPLSMDGPCFIIAEAGSNHNGDLRAALALIDAAADAGADAVKFQLFEAKRLYPRSAGTSDYLGDPTAIFDIIQAMELPKAWLPVLKEHASTRQIAFMASPFHEEAVELLAAHVDAFKIASYELTHKPLLRTVAQHGMPVILSTGASRLDEVSEAVHTLQQAGCTELALMQCTASYPAPLESVNVRSLVTMREKFQLPTGLSDHSADPITAPMTAAALGASVIEKHFTLSRRLPGPDHAFAIEPDELAELVRRVRAVECARGQGDKVVHEVEKELRAFARRSVFVTQAIQAGEQFTRSNVDVLRHGKLAAGLPPSALDEILNSRAARALSPETPLQQEDLE